MFSSVVQLTGTQALTRRACSLPRRQRPTLADRPTPAPTRVTPGSEADAGTPHRQTPARAARSHRRRHAPRRRRSKPGGRSRRRRACPRSRSASPRRPPPVRRRRVRATSARRRAADPTRAAARRNDRPRRSRRPVDARAPLRTPKPRREPSAKHTDQHDAGRQQEVVQAVRNMLAVDIHQRQAVSSSARRRRQRRWRRRRPCSHLQRTRSRSSLTRTSSGTVRY